MATTLPMTVDLSNGSNVSSHRANCSSTIVPNMKTYLLNLSQPYVITFSVLGVATFVILVIYLEEVVRLLMASNPKRSRRDKAKWLLGVYPIMAFTSFMALIVPRTSDLNNLVSSIYLAVCVHVFVAMLIDLFGGPVQMLDTLSKSRLHLDVPPLCCCCRCLPTLAFNKTRLRVLKILVMQFAVFRPLNGYIQAIIWTNQADTILTAAEAKASRFIGHAYALSSVVAIWSFAMVFRMSRGPLKDFHVTPKFVCFQSVIIINSIQPAIFNILVDTGVIMCDSSPIYLPSQAVASRWNHIFVIGEIFLLSIAARLVYFRRQQQEKHEREQQQQQQQKQASSYDADTVSWSSTLTMERKSSYDTVTTLSVNYI